MEAGPRGKGGPGSQRPDAPASPLLGVHLPVQGCSEQSQSRKPKTGNRPGARQQGTRGRSLSRYRVRKEETPSDVCATWTSLTRRVGVKAASPKSLLRGKGEPHGLGSQRLRDAAFRMEVSPGDILPEGVAGALGHAQG